MLSTDYLIEFRNATIGNGSYKVLEHVDLKLGEAEFCYLVGKTGSGKSSFLKTIYAENRLIEGDGFVLGQSLKSMKRKDIPALRRQLGMVFQSFQLFQEWSVARNLAYVLSVTGWKEKSKMQARIEEVLIAVSLMPKMKELVHNLSGGEQQRVAIARALLNNPKIIIADEPTGNLDPETSDQILYLLRDLALEQGTAILVATHDQRILNKFPARIFHFRNETIEETSI